MLSFMLLLASADAKIFDGKTLNGWEVVGGGKWSVGAGILRGECAKADE